MTKILFTIQWYGLPSHIATSANALCDKNVITELKKNKEYEIHVLSYGVSGYPLEENVDGVFVHRFRRGFLFDLCVKNRASKSFFYRILDKINRILLRVKQIIFIPIFPNFGPLHTLHYEREAIKLHEKYKFDIILSEFNGIDSVYAGLAVKKRDKDITYIPLCWDSISGGRLVGFLPRNLCLKLRRRAENKVMKFADVAVVMRSSKPFHEKYTSEYSYYNKLFYLDVPYFVVREKSSEKKKLGRTIRMLYSGTMTDRSPKPLFDILSRTPWNFDFLFICHSEFHSKLQEYNDIYSNISVRCLPYMSHEELSKYQEESDVLVNFGVSNLNAVSGKIFDYMTTGKAIISTAKFENEACIPYLKKYPLAFVLYEYADKNSNTQKTIEFLGKIDNVVVDVNKIRDEFVENDPKTYADFITQKIEERRK